MQSNQYDVIIIGSGMGALTTGSILAQVGKKRVLIVERHFKLGGFTHSFRRQKYEWDVGVHYIGQMQKGSMARGVMDLVTRGGVDWHKLDASFERFMFPQETFSVPDEVSLFKAKLIDRFPDEKAAIQRYFRDVRKAQRWIARWFVLKQYPEFWSKLVLSIGSSLASMTTGEYLLKFKDPLLRAILASQWPDFGTPPGESAFGIHSVVAADYFHGGFYPVGGSRKIAEHAIAAIEENGGKCLVNHFVID